MSEKYEFKEITFNNKRLMLGKKIIDPELGEVLLCLGENGRVYINNNEIITNQEIIDNLDRQYWRAPELRGIVEGEKHKSISELNKAGQDYDR